MVQFKAPEESLGNLNAEAMGSLIAAAGDVAFIVDAEGVIRDVAFNSAELAQEGSEAWLGHAFLDTVTKESRPKISDLLEEAKQGQVKRWRQVNHPSPGKPDIPIIYYAQQLDSDRTIVVGRDMRAFATLQQRLVDVQMSLERDYARLRDFETRYRLLFDMTSEPVVILDAASTKLVEANPAAHRRFGWTKGAGGRAFFDKFDGTSKAELQQLLERVRSVGRAEEVQVQSSEDGSEFLVSAFLFRHERSLLFLVRLSPVAEQGESDMLPKTRSKFVKILETTPDGFVLTGPDQRIIATNSAFLEMAQLATEEQVRGEPLERWLGRSAVDLNVLVANVREHGSVRLFATVLQGEYGMSSEVEVSGVQVVNGEQPCFGLMIRYVDRRSQGQQPQSSGDSRASGELPRSVEQLTDLVGRVPLKEIVRETTDVVERLCIEAALELTGDNRASAAEMLGLSRQSLYVKLRRYGLGDLEPEAGD
ncbi:transcriptional regulator PpsR [Rhodovibrio salinarum]|uniref:Transcriptional regulator PpsR n=1 Tax=Rhodovibrio salinarum TaxID=1087 RepID=A0A934QI49_9PROT|nr:transcriptional regulator PpsR [Rhodovibrio salinarum]MBK1697463.1 transcriptional regulator PpsR [Rhodovibrio salinarum]